MKIQRKFIIKLKSTESPDLIDSYVKDIFRNSIGVFFEVTRIIENAKEWKYKRNCEKSINLLETKLDSTKLKLKQYNFQLLEITDNKILRNIKLSKIKKLKKETFKN